MGQNVVFAGTDDSSIGRLFLAVQQLRKVTLGRIAKCSNASALVSEAPLLVSNAFQASVLRNDVS